MFAMLLAFATAAAGLYALLVLTAAWLRYGRVALAVRGELARCPEMRVFSYRIVQRTPAPQPAARVIAFPVRTRLSAAPQPLRAAA